MHILIFTESAPRPIQCSIHNVCMKVMFVPSMDNHIKREKGFWSKSVSLIMDDFMRFCFGFLSLQTSLLCIVEELAGKGSVAVDISDK